MAVGYGVAFFQQFSGVNAFIYYAPILFAYVRVIVYSLPSYSNIS